VDDPGIRHSLDGGRDVFTTTFALDHKVMNAGWRCVKHDEASIANKKRKYAVNIVNIFVSQEIISTGGDFPYQA